MDVLVSELFDLVVVAIRTLSTIAIVYFHCKLISFFWLVNWIAATHLSPASLSSSTVLFFLLSYTNIIITSTITSMIMPTNGHIATFGSASIRAPSTLHTGLLMHVHHWWRHSSIDVTIYGNDVIVGDDSESALRIRCPHLKYGIWLGNSESALRIRCSGLKYSIWHKTALLYECRLVCSHSDRPNKRENRHCSISEWKCVNPTIIWMNFDC